MSEIYHCKKGHEWIGNMYVPVMTEGALVEKFCAYCYRDMIARQCAIVESGPLPEPTLCKCRDCSGRGYRVGRTGEVPCLTCNGTVRIPEAKS